MECIKIEEANIKELDWALAHMGSGKSKKTGTNGGGGEDWIREAESKVSTEEVCRSYTYLCRIL